MILILPLFVLLSGAFIALVIVHAAEKKMLTSEIELLKARLVLQQAAQAK